MITINFRYTLVFLLGFLSSAFLFYIFFSPAIEVPFSTGFVSLGNVAPSNWVSGDNITVLEDKIILNIKNATLSDYAATGSMKPIFDKGAHGIRIVPQSAEEINVGDIISFRVGRSLIVHRVIEKGLDSKGVYFLTQGDNNLFSDGKIRFEDIEYVTVGIIW